MTEQRILADTGARTRRTVPRLALEYGRRALPLLVVVPAVAAFPYYGTTFYLTLLTTVLIYGVFAMSLDLLMGFSGMPSFGHAAFFGVGGYASALLSLHVTTSLWATLGTSIIVCAFTAIVMGFFATRAAGVYFIMLTLALCQILFSLASRLDSIGGGNGLPGISRPSFSPLPEVFNFWDRKTFFYLTLVFFGVSYLILRIVVASPFGQALVGIRENEQRMHSLGYATKRYKIGAFVISGCVGGCAGSFYVYQNGFISPDALSWTLSGVAMVMVIIGGAGTLYGPVLGAAMYVFLQDIVSTHTSRWQMIFGFTLIGFVLFARGGIAGVGKLLSRRVRWLTT